MKRCPECGSTAIEREPMSQHTLCRCEDCGAEWRCNSRGVLRSMDFRPADMLEGSGDGDEDSEIQSMTTFV